MTMKFGRYTRWGAAVGLMLASGIEVWRRSMASSDWSGESVGFNSMLLAVAAGFPTSPVTALLVDLLEPALRWIPGMDLQYLLLVGVVANWMLIGWGVDHFTSGPNREGTPTPPPHDPASPAT